MNTIAVYPGSFDPITNGHLDIVGARRDGLRPGRRRRPRQPAQVAAAVGRDAGSRSSERRSWPPTASPPTAFEVVAFDGLTVDFCRARGASAIVRGLRAISDFETEMQLAHNNRVLAPEVDTVFFMTSVENGYVSSSLVKEIASFGGDVVGDGPGRRQGSARARRWSGADAQACVRYCRSQPARPDPTRQPWRALPSTSSSSSSASSRSSPTARSCR